MEVKRLIRYMPLLCLIMGGCSLWPGQQNRQGTTRLPPGADPPPSQVGSLAGPLRNHTEGTKGDVLNCDVSPLGDLIAFSWNEHTVYPKIYVKPVKGGSPRQITFGDWEDRDPQFAPQAPKESYKIAYASKRDGNFDIWMVTLSGPGGACQLTDDGADELHPSFSPDGREIAFCRRHKNAGWGIWKQNLANGQQTLLGRGKNPAWSPTGKWIAFQLPTGHSDPVWSLWIMRPDGTERTQIVSYPAHGATHPAWSPNGRHIAYAKILQTAGRDTGLSSANICAVEIQTGRTFRITTHRNTFATQPCWDPGLEGWIFFSSTNATGRFNIVSGKINPQLLHTGFTHTGTPPGGNDQ